MPQRFYNINDSYNNLYFSPYLGLIKLQFNFKSSLTAIYSSCLFYYCLKAICLCQLKWSTSIVTATDWGKLRQKHHLRDSAIKEQQGGEGAREETWVFCSNQYLSIRFMKLLMQYTINYQHIIKHTCSIWNLTLLIVNKEIYSSYFHLCFHYQH